VHRLSQRDLIPLAFLVGLVCVVFRQIALEGRVLAGFDAEAYFYPNAAYLVSSLRSFRLPLWNPYLFAGVPFLANSQVGALYPPNYLYALGPISVVASYLIVGHLIWFAIGMYVLARVSLGLERFGACVAAAVASTSGLTGGMVGHINQVEALAWAPISIVLVERGVAHRSFRMAVLAAIPISLALFAGHAQVVYLTLAFAVTAGISRYIQMSWASCQIRRRSLVARDLAAGAGLVLAGPIIALFTSAAQLLPTLELTRASIRSTGLDFADAAAGSLPPPYLPISLFPTVGQPPSSTEWLAYVPVGAMLLAIIGLWRRRHAESWWLFGVAIVGLILAFGQYTPLFRIAFEVVPGFRLFRVPARWLAIWVIALALLAGWGADAVTCEPFIKKEAKGADTEDMLPARTILGRTLPPTGIIVGGSVITIAAIVFAYRFRHVIARPSLATLGLWITASLGTLLTLRLTGSSSVLRRIGLMVVLALELTVASLSLPSEEAVWPAAVETARATVDHLRAFGATDRVLGIGDNTFDPGDLASIRASLDDTLPPAARDDYVTALKHVEGLTPNIPLRYSLRMIDGYDGGILPLARYHDFKRLFAKEGQDVADGRLRIQLRSAPSPMLLSWLNVRWLVMDRLRDHWDNGYYYDLSILEPLADDVPIALHPQEPIVANRVGVVLRGPGATAPIGTLRLDVGGTSVSLQTGLVLGTTFPTDPASDPKGVWLWTVDLPASTPVDAVTATWQGDSGTILRGLTAIDDSAHLGEPIAVSPALRYSAIGDMKIYEVATVRPRAFLADGLTVMPTIDNAVARLNQTGWDPVSEAVAVASEVSPSLAFAVSPTSDDAKLTVDEPERVVVQTAASDRRMLVLTDSYFPGWHATVDGVELPIIPVNLLFRGVMIPAGHHVVEFDYRPVTWYAGLALSALGLGGLVLALVVTSKRAGEVDGG
jgi:hypothetical protein